MMQLTGSARKTIGPVQVGSLIEETSDQTIVGFAPHVLRKPNNAFGRQAGADQDRRRIHATPGNDFEEHRDILGKDRVPPLSYLVNSTAHTLLLPEICRRPALSFTSPRTTPPSAALGGTEPLSTHKVMLQIRRIAPTKLRHSCRRNRLPTDPKAIA